MSRLLVALVLVHVCSFEAAAFDVSSSWNNSTGLWTDASSWSTTDYPDNGNGGLDYRAIVSGGTVTVDVDVTVDEFRQTGGTVSADSSVLTVVDALTFTAGTISGAGQIVAASTASLTIDSNGNVPRIGGGGTLVNEGAAAWSPADPQQIDIDGTFQNDGTFTTNSDSLLRVQGSGSFENNGMFLKQGAGTFDFSFNEPTPFNNNGTVDIQQGRLQLRGGAHTGDFQIAAGASLRSSASQSFSAASDITGDGQFVLAGGTTTTDGQLSPTGGVSISGSNSTLDVNSTTSTARLSQAFGVLRADGTLTVLDAMGWAGGNLSGSGQLVISTEASLTIDSNGNLPRISSGGTLINEGTATWSPTEPQSIAIDGTFQNDSTFTTNSDSLLRVQGSGSFENNGMFLKQGAGTFDFGFDIPTTLNNHGTVDIQQGRLTLRDNALGGLFQISGGQLFTNVETTNNGEVRFTSDGGSVAGSSTLVNPAGSLIAKVGGAGNVSISKRLSNQGLVETTSGNVRLTSSQASVSAGEFRGDPTNRIVLAGSASFEFRDGATVNGDKAVLIETEAHVDSGATLGGSGSVEIAPGGRFEVIGTSSLPVHVSGRLDGGGTIDNDIELDSGVLGTINIEGAVTSDGESSVEGGTANVSGITEIVGGKLTIAPNGALTGPGPLDLNGGSVAVQGTLAKNLLIEGSTVIEGSIAGALIPTGNVFLNQNALLPLAADSTQINPAISATYFGDTQVGQAGVSGTLILPDGAVFRVPGAFTIDSGGMVTIETGSSTVEAGTLEVEGTVHLEQGSRVETDSLEVNPGSLVIGDADSSIDTSGLSGSGAIGVSTSASGDSNGQLAIDPDVILALPSSISAGMASNQGLEPLALKGEGPRGPGLIDFSVAASDAFTINIPAEQPDAMPSAWFEFDINDAVGTMGGPLGWDAVTASQGGIVLTQDGGSTIGVSVTSLTTENVLGPLANFDPSTSYEWTFLDAALALSGDALVDLSFVVDDSDFAMSNSVPTGLFSVEVTGTGLVLVYEPVQPGDYDSDGDVDLADALLGQRLGEDLSLGSEWSNNFGTGALPELVVKSVPEPAACLLTLLGICLVAGRRR